MRCDIIRLCRPAEILPGKPRPPFRSDRGGRAFLVAIALAVATTGAFSPRAFAADSDVSTALKSLQRITSVTRTVTLRDIGFTAPVVLSSLDARREIYLPVPADLPLEGANLMLHAQYLRADGGHTTFVLSLDGYPVAAQAPNQEDGTLSFNLGVDGAARNSGFVRLGASWSSAIDDVLCTDNRAPGNVVKIAPSSSLTYSYDPTAIENLRTAWTALPSSPAILVAGRSLSAEAYDAAWRVGIALERAGKRARFVALPAVGDEVDLAGLAVPPALAAVPAFSALSGAGKHRLANPAEVGAYLLLAGGRHADLAIADLTLTDAIRGALDALGVEIATGGPSSAASFAALRKQADSLSTGLSSTDGIAIATLGRLPVIAIAPGAAGKTSALFSALWRSIATVSSMTATTAELAPSASNTVSLAALGGTPSSFNVLADGDWIASFDLSALSSDGRIPDNLVVDTAAAPGASSSAPVVSVFLNDYLLGARQLHADGQAERVTAQIPRYALHPSNVLRISFQRQPVSDRCRENPQAYPVAVLPSSHITLTSSEESADFLGVVPHLAGRSALLLPTTYLTDAPNSLEAVVRLADAAKLSPQLAKLTLIGSSDKGAVATSAPELPFLALDVELSAPDDHRVVVSADRLVLASDPKSPLLDVSGLDRLGVIEAVQGKAPGLIYRQIGAHGPAFTGPISLSNGDIAIISDAGKVVEINSHPSAASEPAARRAQGWSWSRIWHDSLNWGGLAIAIAVVGLFLLLLRAAFVRNRRGRG